jgi:hypothetical protein
VGFGLGFGLGFGRAKCVLGGVFGLGQQDELMSLLRGKLLRVEWRDRL